MGSELVESLAYVHVTRGRRFLSPSPSLGCQEAGIPVLEPTRSIHDPDFSWFTTRETGDMGLRGTLDRRRGSSASDSRLVDPRPAVMRSPANQWVSHSRSSWSAVTTRTASRKCFRPYGDTPLPGSRWRSPPSRSEGCLCVGMIMGSKVEAFLTCGGSKWKQSGSKVEALPLSLLDFQKRDSP